MLSILLLAPLLAASACVAGGAPATPAALELRTMLAAADSAATPADSTAAPAGAERITWRIDRAHSELSFRVRHMVSRVPGSFGEWSGIIVADPENWSTAEVNVTVQVASIDTQNEKRDTHLRSGDFFDAERYPTITFRSTSVERERNRIRLAGELTMRGITRPVVLEGEFLGMTKAARGKRRAGFAVSTTINRLDYGVSWNRAAEGGGMVLDDNVTIDVVIAAIEQ